MGNSSSFEALREDDPVAAQRYLALAVMLEDMAVAAAVQQTLWNVDEAEALETVGRFVGLSLAQRDASGDGIRLHDLQLDYVRAQYPNPEALELIRGAVRLSAHVIEKDPRQFASQVVGRLLAHRDGPAIQQCIDEIAAAAPKPWLRPLHLALNPPGTPLLYTLEGHSAAVWGAAVTADGKRAVSACWDHTLKVWDLATGRALRTLEGHSAPVSGVATNSDGQRAVSASVDRTLKVWDLDTGRELRTLEGHSDIILGVAVTQDGKQAVSASRDDTLKVWDLETGRALRTLEGHSDHVNGVAVTPDARQAVSASQDKTLKVWDLETGRALRTLESHSNDVFGVAVTPDGKRAVSASSLAS
jgi:WD40 repeat protein